jgi:tRNA-Thr(GGU) m(6)t(6)A37 methyltransferase TsaA
MSQTISLTPVACVRGGRDQAIDDSWDNETARIALDPRFGPEALAGLEAFSHIEVIFHFDRAPEAEIVTGASHPRGNTNWPKVGIFCQRGKGRPSRLGVTVCRLLAVEGTALLVRGLDAIDGTPVLDIKPLVKGFLPHGDIRQAQWADEIMKDYWAKAD